MSLIQTIKEDQVRFRKAGHKLPAAQLTTLIGESEAVGKNKGNRAPTDEEVMTVIRKFIKGIDETRSLTKDSAYAETERQLYQGYLPAQLTEDQIGVMVELLKGQGKNKGEIMKWFKENHAGLYDGKFVSSLV